MSAHEERDRLEVVVSTKPELLGNFALLDANRATWQQDFADRILADPRIRGEVLEIGSAAGSEVAAFQRIYGIAAAIDGVDPDASVQAHPHLRRRWVSTLEEAKDIRDESYDAAFALLVVEHVAKPRQFLARVFRLLKPGGVFYATTPSSHHPFAWMVRGVQAMQLKSLAARRSTAKINAYPAYYRMNSRRAVVPIARELGFCRAEFFMYPCINWDTYFPRRLRFVPHLYDILLGGRYASLAQTMMIRLDKDKAAVATRSSPA